MADSDNIRSLTFSNSTEIEFEGNILRKAICFADVDNDGLNELITGNDKGIIAIFKDETTKAACRISVKGMISAIAVGDVVNIRRNILLVITVCGHLYLFDLNKSILKENILPFHTQRIPANIKEVIIGDANGDGFCEIVVSMTDRVVRTYRWFGISETEEDWKCGKLVGLNKWEFAEQVGSISFVSMSDGGQSLLVAQPGGNFIVPKVESVNIEKYSDSVEESSTELLTKIPLDFEAPSNMKLQNAEICSSSTLVKRSDILQGPTFAFVTLDGNLVLVVEDKIQWKLQLDHQLFSVHCLDVNNDGVKEVIACAWDGTTFIVDYDRRVVKFVFREAVSAFSAGLLGLNGKNVPCFVYCTFNNSLYLYHNVSLPSISLVSLLDDLRESQEFKDVAQSSGFNSFDDKSLRKLVHFMLYESNNLY